MMHGGQLRLHHQVPELGQHFSDRPTDHVGTGRARHALRRRVHLHNAARLVQHDDARMDAVDDGLPAERYKVEHAVPRDRDRGQNAGDHEPEGRQIDRDRQHAGRRHDVRHPRRHGADQEENGLRSIRGAAPRDRSHEEDHTGQHELVGVEDVEPERGTVLDYQQLRRAEALQLDGAPQQSVSAVRPNHREHHRGLDGEQPPQATSAHPAPPRERHGEQKECRGRQQDAEVLDLSGDDLARKLRRQDLVRGAAGPPGDGDEQDRGPQRPGGVPARERDDRKRTRGHGRDEHRDRQLDVRQRGPPVHTRRPPRDAPTSDLPRAACRITVPARDSPAYVAIAAGGAPTESVCRGPNRRDYTMRCPDPPRKGHSTPKPLSPRPRSAPSSCGKAGYCA